MSIIKSYLDFKNSISEASNADELRDKLSDLGYTEKSKELSSGGDITDDIQRIAEVVLSEFKKIAPEVKVTVTGGNDAFHHNLSYVSRHTKGQAVDLVVTPNTPETRSKMISVLDRVSDGTPGFSYIDEYTNPTKAATAGHFHISYGNNPENSRTANAKTDDPIEVTGLTGAVAAAGSASSDSGIIIDADLITRLINKLKEKNFSEKDLAKFSTGATKLSSDLASFYNTSADEAITAIGAALRGESEPIRKYGVLLDDATLKAKAMEMGLYDGKGALDVQAKSLAAYQVILDQTKDAQGDFSRTSDGLAAQQKILTAQLENLKTTMGTNLLPVAKEVVTQLNFMAAAFGGDDPQGLTERARELAGVYDGQGSGAYNLVLALKNVGDSFSKMFDSMSGPNATEAGTALQNIANAINKIAEAFDKLGNAYGKVKPIFDAIASFFNFSASIALSFSNLCASLIAFCSSQ